MPSKIRSVHVSIEPITFQWRVFTLNSNWVYFSCHWHLTGQSFRAHEKWKKESARRKTIRSKIKTANKELKKQQKLQSKISPVARFDPERTRISQLRSLKSNVVTLKPDGAIVREMKKYKVQRQTKTFIQISRNKTIVSPRLRKDII